MNPPESSPLLLSVRHLRVERPGARPARAAACNAVEDFHLDLRDGEAVTVLGAAGSGRAELAQALAGRSTAAGGSIRYLGAPLATEARKPSMPPGVALIAPQPFAAAESKLSALQWILDAQDAAHPGEDATTRMRRLAALLARVGLIAADLHRPLRSIEEGPAARLALAGALLQAIRLMICDEPITLASEARCFAAVVDGLRAEHGFALIYGTADPQTAIELGQRVLTMYRGRIVESAPTGVLGGHARHPYTRLLLGDPELTTAAQQMEISDDDDGPVLGCTFHPRCPLADPMCVRSLPGLRRVGDEHYAACHFVAADER